MDCSHFFAAVFHSKVKCIFCDKGAFLLCHDLETFYDSCHILKDRKSVSWLWHKGKVVVQCWGGEGLYLNCRVKLSNGGVEWES